MHGHSFQRGIGLPTRRAVLGSALGGLCVASGVTRAQSAPWPSRPIRMVVPQAPGGGIDILARIVGPELADVLHQPVIVDNKPGASANIGADYVAHAPADGYTVLYGINQIVSFNPHIYPKLSYNALTDLVPVTQTSTVGFILMVNNELPVKSVQELVAYAKKNPGKLSYGTWGAGSAHHLGMELFSQMAGVNMVHVPYKQAPVTDLMSGTLDVLFEVTASMRPFIAEGKVRALAYTGATRHPEWPNLPTVAETFPGYELISWHGVWLPRGAPQQLVDRLNTEVVRIVRKPEIQKKMVELTFTPTGTSAAEFQQIVLRDNKSWGEVIRERNIKMD